MWQPIETAPRDGTEVLVCEAPRTFSVCVAWHHGRKGKKWWSVHQSRFVDPTHWMPIPPVPKEVK